MALVDAAMTGSGTSLFWVRGVAGLSSWQAIEDKVNVPMLIHLYTHCVKFILHSCMICQIRPFSHSPMIGNFSFATALAEVLTS
jgi:hypothetical protein